MEVILLRAFGLTGLTTIDPALSSITLPKKFKDKTVYISYSDTGTTEQKYFRSYHDHDIEQPTTRKATLRVFKLTGIKQDARTI